MKLIIDVDENLVCEGFERPLTEEERNTLIRAIGNAKSYNPSGDCISRSALKEAIETYDKFACLPDTTLVPFHMLNEPEKNYEPYVHLRDIRNAIDNAQTVEPNDDFYSGYVKGLGDAKSDIITLIANEYTSHSELIPNWLTIGEIKVADRQKKGGAE